MNDKPTEREQILQGLREAIDFIDAEGVPVHGHQAIYYFVDHAVPEQGDRRAEVDRVAALLGVQARDGYNGAYEAQRTFGPVVYRAVSHQPGPQPGLCAICRENPVRHPDAEGLAARLCTPCLGEQADLIDPPAPPAECPACHISPLRLNADGVCDNCFGQPAEATS